MEKDKNDPVVKCMQCKSICTQEQLKIVSVVVKNQGSLWAEWCFNCKDFYEKYDIRPDKISEDLKNNHGYSCLSTCACKDNERYIVEHVYAVSLSDRTYKGPVMTEED